MWVLTPVKSTALGFTYHLMKHRPKELSYFLSSIGIEGFGGKSFGSFAILLEIISPSSNKIQIHFMIPQSSCICCPKVHVWLWVSYQLCLLSTPPRLGRHGILGYIYKGNKERYQYAWPRDNLFPFIAPISLSIDLMNVKHPYSLVPSSNSLMSRLLLHMVFFCYVPCPKGQMIYETKWTYPKIR